MPDRLNDLSSDHQEHPSGRYRVGQMDDRAFHIYFCESATSLEALQYIGKAVRHFIAK